jgi:hypothetical protein
MKEEKYNHNEMDPNIPDGLEYQDAYWQDALAKLQRHERRSDRRKRFFAFGLLAVVIGFVWGISQCVSTTGPVVNLNDTVNQNKAIPPTHTDQLEGSVNSPHTEHAKMPMPMTEKNSTSPKPNSPSVVDEIILSKNTSSTRAGDQTIGEKDADHPFIHGTKTIADDNVRYKVDPSKPQVKLNSEETYIGLKTPNAIEHVTSIFQAASNLASEKLDFKPQAKDKLESRYSTFVPIDLGLRQSNYLPYERPWSEPKWRLGGNLGLSLVTHYASPLRDLSADPILGIRLEHNVKNRWAFRSGLEYFSISNVRKPYAVASIAYDINYIKTVTTVETHRLYYLSLPVSIGYRINRKHQFWGGAGISYMLTGKNEIATHRITTASVVLLNKREDMGFVAGFRDFPCFVQAGYEWRFSQHIFGNIAWQQGLTDITKNNYFDNPIRDRNTRLFLTIGYDISKK